MSDMAQSWQASFAARSMLSRGMASVMTRSQDRKIISSQRRRGCDARLIPTLPRTSGNKHAASNNHSLWLRSCWCLPATADAVDVKQLLVTYSSLWPWRG